MLKTKEQTKTNTCFVGSSGFFSAQQVAKAKTQFAITDNGEAVQSFQRVMPAFLATMPQATAWC